MDFERCWFILIGNQHISTGCNSGEHGLALFKVTDGKRMFAVSFIFHNGNMAFNCFFNGRISRLARFKPFGTNSPQSH